MKTTATYHESYQPKQGFGARLLFYAFLLSIIGLSKAFAQVPSAPVATAATNFTCTSFNANWMPVAGGTAYFLDVSTDNSFASFLAGFSNFNTGNVTTSNVVGLIPGVFYYYRVRVQDINGTSLNSNVVTFQTCAPTYIISPVDGATINSACDLNFCIHNDNINYSGEPYINDSIGTLLSYGSIASIIDSLCLISANASYSYSSGYHTFYLQDNFVVTDSVTLYFPNPINSLQNQLTLAQTPTTNGGYDFTMSGFSPSETYTMIFNNYYNNQIDTLLVSNTTTAAISHQYPYNGYFYGDITVIGGCQAAISYDSIFVSVSNSSCSSYVSFDNISLNTNGNCSTGQLDLFTVIYWENLQPADSSQFVINWGDGNTETLQVWHAGYTFGSGTPVNIAHQYTSSGTYTASFALYDPTACFASSVIHSITIGSTTCGSLYGAIFSDINTNCTLDNGTDLGVSNQLITATDNSGNVYYAWTDFNGNYAFNTLPNGTYVVDLAYLNSGYSITCSGAFPQTVTINNNSIVADCPVTCSGAFDAAITGISIWSALYPGQPEMILPHVGILNGGCNSTVVAGQVKIVLDACTQYTSPSTYSGAGAPDAVITAATGDTLVWNVADINNIGNFSYYDYAINILMCTTAQVGDSACITMIVEPLTGDADPTNNTYTRCFEIGVSYDPNNKEVMPAGDGAQGFIPADQPSLTYTLNFQNTGTAKAFNIYVMDTISANLDINSIEILSASHKMQVYTLPNRAVKFMFADIMLADSTHDEPNSHGYVTFKIKVNAGLTPGTEIENTGHIYFDYNEPVVTNTTLNTIEFPSSVQTLGKSTVVKVFPNPAKESVTVVSNSNSTGVITITDLLGKTVKEVTTTNEKTVVNTADLQSGVYFIKLTQNNVSKTEKIMIAK